MTTRVRRLAAAAAVLTLVGLGAAACSAGDDEGSDTSAARGATSADDAGGDVGSGGSDGVAAEAAVPEAAPAPADAPDAFAANLDQLADRDQLATASDGAGAGSTGTRTPDLAPAPGETRSLIKTGNVALRAKDVDGALFEIRKVLQQTGGEVAEENTTADDDGDSETSLLTVRVPVGQFETALGRLKALSTTTDGVDLIDSSSTSQDVSTQVIDTNIRTQLQKRSIQRISILLDRATSIRDIVSIERELARREADLGSLEKRQAFLADQTSLSTITISVERPAVKATTIAAKEKAEVDLDQNAFAAGLTNGWDAFTGATNGLLTTVGALLPFAILALVVGVPLRIWLRRRQPAPAVATVDAT